MSVKYGLSNPFTLREGVRRTMYSLTDGSSDDLQLYITDNKVPTTLSVEGDTLSVKDTSGREVKLFTFPNNPGYYEPIESGTSVKLGEDIRISLDYFDKDGVYVSSALKLYAAKKQDGTFVISADKNDVWDLLFLRGEGADNWKNTVAQKNLAATYSDEIKALSTKICAGLTSDYDKAKAISKWITENISYDEDTFENMRNHRVGVVSGQENYIVSDSALDGIYAQTADGVLKNGYGVCSGFASLTKALIIKTEVNYEKA